MAGRAAIWVAILALGVTALGAASSSSAAPARRYGAIAYSMKSNTYGYSDSYASEGPANTRALAECGGGDCQIATWFYNSCGALATGAQGAWGAEQGANANQASVLAVARCKVQGGGAACKVIVSHCSG